MKRATASMKVKPIAGVVLLASLIVTIEAIVKLLRVFFEGCENPPY